MQHLVTVLLALDLFKVPSRVRLAKSNPVPDGIVTLLRIAGGDSELAEQASVAIGCSRSLVREAAEFFVEQTLLHPEADSYRVLGARPNASTDELRRNMAILLRWLHPDHGQGERSVFAHRVTRAWNDLKTEERRIAYDRLRRNEITASGAKTRDRSRSSQLRHSINAPKHHTLPRRPRKARSLLQSALFLLLGRTVN